MGVYTLMLFLFGAGFISGEYWLCGYAVVGFILFALIDYALERTDDDEYF